jgi:AraC-like DNA-binding protein
MAFNDQKIGVKLGGIFGFLLVMIAVIICLGLISTKRVHGSVETIAKECGFGNTERMRRTFQRLFDVSPHDYRARFRSTLLT